METIRSLLGFLLESSQGEKFIQRLRLPLCLDAEAIPTEFLPYPFNVRFRYCFIGYVYKVNTRMHFRTARNIGSY